MKSEKQMRLWEPVYYFQFACLKGNCRHSCCQGWEIDIDEKTYKKFQQIPGDWGDKLRSSIVREKSGRHFVLDKEGRCPFLTTEGLCEIILNRGEKDLCQICRDHPRYYHEFTDHVEVGLGLCCEAAAYLCLTWPDPVTWIIRGETEKNQDPREQALLSLRTDCIQLIQNRSLSMSERMKKLQSRFAIDVPKNNEAMNIFVRLERMDAANWGNYLEKIQDEPKRKSLCVLNTEELALEQWMAYLLNRNLPDALLDDNVRGHLGMCVMIWDLSYRLFETIKEQTNVLSVDCMVDIIRLISAEIEYSQENKNTLVQVCS